MSNTMFANPAVFPDNLGTLIFKDCPFSIQDRSELKKTFYEKRRDMIKAKLSQKERKVDLHKYVMDYYESLEKQRKNEKNFNETSVETGIRDRQQTLVTFLSQNHIDYLKKDDVIEIIHYSWAQKDIWTDFPTKALDVIEKNGLPKLRRELKRLLYGTTPLPERFDDFITKVKGFGAQYTSEILTFIYPENCCLWNRVVADSVILLGINDLLPYEVWKNGMVLDGKGYEKCCEVLKKIKNDLGNFLPKPDFLDIHTFIMYIYAQIIMQPDILEEIRIFSKQLIY